MKRKQTARDYALWAALPMAQTSKIEDRLTLILDITRRRTLPKRTFILGTALTAAVLVPLSMLRPAVLAQPASAASNVVRIAGITDPSVPNGVEWDENGQPLTSPVLRQNLGALSQKFSASAGQKALLLPSIYPIRNREIYK